jgi:uncharacterized protein YcaQ
VRIDNRTARHLWLSAQGLATPPTGPLDLPGIVRKLGFVQLDSIQVVARAHHHILWSRNAKYREPMYDRLLSRDRAVFEHFTHDASILPMEFLPYWRRQFDRKRERIGKAGWYSTMCHAAEREAIKARIAAEGPLSTAAFDTKIAGPKEMWSRPPHKLALDFMWYAGELATSHRAGFTKHYDLAERIYPAHLRDRNILDEQAVDWLCTAALDRLVFATPGEIQRFWDAVDRREVSDWTARAALQPVEVETGEGTWLPSLAPPDIEERIAALAPLTARLRILNPFDPAVRDRARLARVFGFDYRVEMFVPAAKRIWGYYVFPILEGHRFTGRIEVKADRKGGALNVLNFWPEPGVAWPDRRRARLVAELERMARFVGVGRVTGLDG